MSAFFGVTRALILGSYLMSLPSQADGYYNRVMFVRPGCAKITRVQSVPSGTNSLAAQGLSQSQTITQSAGNLVVAIAASTNVPIAYLSISDTLGNAWVATSPRDHTAGYGHVQVFFAQNVSPGTNTVTASQWPGSQTLAAYTSLTLIEYAGVATASALDALSGQIASSNTSVASTGSILTTSSCPELLVAAFADNTTDFTATGSGFLTVFHDTFAAVLVEDNSASLTPPATSVNASASLGAADNSWVAVQLAFRAQGSNPGPAPTQLAFTSAPQTLSAPWQCSNAVTVQTQSAGGQPVGLTAPLVINYSGSGVQLYSDSACSVPLSSVNIAAGDSSATFYLSASHSPSVTLTLSATGLTSATQTETVSGTLPYVWIGGGSCNGIWSSSICWSTGVAPGPSNVATFDDNCTTNCSVSLSGATSVGGIALRGGFTGSLDLAGKAMTVGASDFRQEAGTFKQSGALLDVQGGMFISGGTSTFDGAINVRKSYALTGGSQNFTGSTLTFNDSVNCTPTWGLDPGNADYNHVVFSDAPPVGCNFITRNFRSGSTMKVGGNLTYGESSQAGDLEFGTIDLKGNLTVTGYGYNSFVMPTLIRLSGSNQSVSATTATQGNLPSLEIASTGGTVTLSGSFVLEGNYKWTSGTVDWVTNATTLNFADPYTCDPSWSIAPGPQNFYNVLFTDAAYCNTVRRTLAAGSTLNVQGALTLGATKVKSNLDGGTIVAANITASNKGYSITSDVSISGNLTASTANAFSATAGTVTLTPGNDHTISGANTFFNLKMDNSAVTTANTLTFASGKIQAISGTLSLAGNTTNRLSIVSSTAGTAATLTVSPQTMGGNLSIRDNVPSSNLHTGAGSVLISNFGTTTTWISP